VNVLKHCRASPTIRERTFFRLLSGSRDFGDQVQVKDVLFKVAGLEIGINLIQWHNVVVFSTFNILELFMK
jgi:hypothetical protein